RLAVAVGEVTIPALLLRPAGPPKGLLIVGLDEELDGHGAAEREIAGQKHFAHAAGAEHALEAVMGDL
ncbi:MAG TPA: hypothetical protein PKW63_17635, partial [Vicinamibacterales bacterium]|nr:hypothetical protein [Vicinamibacterales bacterium]